MLDVQLGLRLWCQPITLLPDEVVVAFAAPHDRSLRHQVWTNGVILASVFCSVAGGGFLSSGNNLQNTSRHAPT